MATVNYSVPEDVKEEFNTQFEGRNKSAIISELMKRAVEEDKRRERRAKAMDALLARRGSRSGMNEDVARGVLEAVRRKQRESDSE